MQRRSRLWMTITVVALLASACGGGSDGGSDDGGISVSATDFQFRPDAFTATAGEIVEVSLENAGTVEHNWVVLSTPIRSESDLTEDQVLFRLHSESGSTSTDSFTAPAAGSYQVVCDIPGHFSAGMEGELTVSG